VQLLASLAAHDFAPGILLAGKQWHTPRCDQFLFAPASPRPLAILRIGVALVLLIQALSLSAHLLELHGPQGWVQWTVSETKATGGIPRLSWWAAALTPLGISAPDCVRLVFLLNVAGLGMLLTGWRTRWAAVLTWFTHTSLIASGSASTYGVDQFAHILLFYFMWMPVGHALSLDSWSGRVQDHATPGCRLSLRVLQFHLCIVYLASGIEKATGSQWWNGEAIWRATLRSDLAQLDMTWLASVPWLARAACWGTLAVEITYAFLVWLPQTRRPMVFAVLMLHAGIAFVLGLVSFAALMMIWNLAAFLVPESATAFAAASSRPFAHCIWQRRRFGVNKTS
jgi:hypothetical protein